MRKNLLGSLVLFPGILLVLVWCWRFLRQGGPEADLTTFLLWSAATAFAVSYVITLYRDFTSSK